MVWNSKTSITKIFFFFFQKAQLVSYNSATNPLLQNKSLILQAWMHLFLMMQEYQGGVKAEATSVNMEQHAKYRNKNIKTPINK